MPDQTLAQMVRAKYPGSYDQLSDQQLEQAVRAKYPGVYDHVPSSAPASHESPGAMPQETWDAMSAADKIKSGLKWAGYAVTGMAGMGAPGAVTPGKDAVDNPKTTLATAAVPLIAQRVAPMIPTRAKAGAQFKQVMGAVGDQPVDIAAPGDAALRIQDMAERGGSMPKVVRDFLRRATDPDKGDITYREARDFYSNISRLSADEYQRLTPAVKMEVGKLRVALDRALAVTAANGGQEDAYRSAMSQYAVASRIHDVASKAWDELVKYGAAAIGAGAAYKVLKKD